MPKEVFGRDYRFLDRRELLDVRGDRAASRGIFVALGVAQAPDHRRRAARAPRPRAADRAARAARRRPDADDERLAAAAEGAGARRRRALTRVTVSLDSLDDATFRALNDVDFPVERVLEGIDAAAAAGLPVKVNAVVKRGVNDDQIVAAGRASSASAATRCASSSTWTSGTRTAGASTTSFRQPRSSRRSTRAFGARAGRAPRTAARSRSAGATATARGEVGVIASVTQPFCGDCTRARLSAEGKLFTCLFAVRGHDLRALVRERRDRRGARSRRSQASGAPAATATRSSARPRRPTCRRSR